MVNLLVFGCTIFCIISGAVASDADDYAELIVHVKQYYQAGSVYLVWDNSKQDFEAENALLSIFKNLSSRTILSQVVGQSKFLEQYHDTISRNTRQLVVVFFDDAKSFDEFGNFTKANDLFHHAWLVVFWSSPELLDLCENSKANGFRLNFDIELLVKCYDDPVVREWFALSPYDSLEINELLDWDRSEGLAPRVTGNFIDRHDDFRGATIRVANIMTSASVDSEESSYDERTSSSLVVERIMSELMLQLNISVEYLPPSSTYGIYDAAANRWNGLLGNLSAGDVDLSFTEFAVTTERVKDFDFTVQIFTTHHALFIRQPDQFSEIAYAEGFESRVWISLFAIIAMGSLVITLLRNRYASLDDFAENFLHVFGIYCQQGLTDFPSSSVLRVAYTSLLFSSIVVFASYSGFIVSKLTTSKLVLPFTDLEEFVKLGTYRLIFVRSNSYDEYLNQNMQDPLLRKVRKLIKKREDLPVSHAEALKQVCNESVAYYTDIQTYERKIVKGLPCKILSIPIAAKTFLAIPLAKNNPLKHYINYYIRRFEDHGLMKRNKKIVHDERRKDSIRKEGVFVAVGFSEVVPLLRLILTGLILGLFIVLFECKYFKNFDCIENF